VFTVALADGGPWLAVGLAGFIVWIVFVITARPTAGLAVMCPRRTSQAYQLEMAASLWAALAGDSPASSSCLAYRATCSAVMLVTGESGAAGTSRAMAARCWLATAV
jgi:hypothetical protein